MRAVRNGYLPTLSRWLEEGTHRLMQWEPDLSSQTAASQAGILLGDNTDIPAFRWYERESGRIMVSSKPQVASEVEARESSGHGLLEGQGTSRNNMFSGDAPVSMFTMSKVLESRRADVENYYAFFAYPFNAVRLMVLFFGEVLREIWHRRKQKRRNVRPRLDHRGKAYPFVRAATTILMRDLTIYALLEDMYAGVPVSYATFVGYDEVAHHSGIERAETMHTLAQLDRQFGRLERASKLAPRPYRFVVLSDHGQSQGATFKMRHGYSLEDLVRKLVETGTEVERPVETSEGWGQINAALTEGTRGDPDSLTAKAVKRGVSKRTYEEGVVLGPEHRDIDPKAGDEEKPKGDVLVMGSGNLGLIYFRPSDHRLTLEEIDAEHPRLIEGLVEHDSVGFVLVRSQAHGAVAIGRVGVYFLDEDRIDGEDPLAAFGPNAPDHLKRTDGFRDVADIMVNSFYDPVWEEVSAFEELVSCHGGLGGTQTEPFVLYPTEWPAPRDAVVGAAALHSVLKSWVNLEQAGAPSHAALRAGSVSTGLPAHAGREVTE
jgi:Type I phosphodiesterase / nucleotide pyrophosphatase